jgi:uncharacterized membrane protein
MMRILMLVAVLALGGCGSKPTEKPTPKPKPTATKPMAMLGTVDLTKPVHVFGVEPGWSLDVAPGDISFADFSGESIDPQPFFPVSPQLAGDRASWTTRNVAGETVVLTLTAKECLEAGEPEDSQPLTAELKIGAKTLKGCAGAKVSEFPDAENASDNATAK